MGGKASRDKGGRGERMAVKCFRDAGWEAYRVPLSGASDGFKADISLAKGNIKLIAEVKNEKDSYKTLYQLLDGEVQKEYEYAAYFDPVTGVFALMSYNFNELGFSDDFSGDQYHGFGPLFQPVLPDSKLPGIKKLFSCAKLLKSADFLMVRINHKPFIYIRYWGIS